MRKIVVETCEDSRPVYLYDTTLPLEERHKHKQWFRSGMAASNFLGVEPGEVYKRMVAGHRITSPKDQKKYSIRPAPDEPDKPQTVRLIQVAGEEELMQLFLQSVHIMNNLKYWTEQWTIKGGCMKGQMEHWEEKRDLFLKKLNVTYRNLNDE